MKTYHIITIGCQMNVSDSERVANYLENLGYSWTDDKNNSSVVITTTCGVRQSAENRVYSLIPDIKKINPACKVVLTGCLSDRPDVQRRLKDDVDIWMPITQLETLAEKLGEEMPKFPDSGSLGGYLKIQPKYQSTFSAFVPIGNGCNNFCTYCVVPYARGRETYRDAMEIVDEAKALVEKGYKEITLIAQNVNSYKSHNAQRITHNEINFPKLLRMVNDIPGDFWLRFTTSNPKDMGDELIDAIAESEKACKYIHLPVQSGDNEILAKMNRHYTREHYLDLITKIRNKLNVDNGVWEPKVLITTDVIVGFPGETREQFENTLSLFEEAKFDMAYIGQYSPRYGTPAAKMKDDVSLEEKAQREKDLTVVLRKTSLDNNRDYMGHVVDVLFDHKKGGYYFGRTRTSRKVRMKSEDDLIGQIKKIKITGFGDFGLEGEAEK